MSMKNLQLPNWESNPRPFGWYRSAWTNCATTCTPSQILHLAFRVHSTKENHSLLTAFGVSFTLFCDVCYIRFVPTVLLDLSCYRLKSLSALRVSLIKSCLCIQGRCIYTEGPRTPHTAYFYYKSITHRESRWGTARRETRHFSIFLVGGCPIGNRSRERTLFFVFLLLNIYIAVFQTLKTRCVTNTNNKCEWVCGNVRFGGDWPVVTFTLV